MNVWINTNEEVGGVGGLEVSVPVLFGIAGAILLITAIFGGFRVEKFEIPMLSLGRRISSGVLGAILMATSFWLYISSSSDVRPNPSPTATNQVLGASSSIPTTSSTTNTIVPTSTANNSILDIREPDDLTKISGSNGAVIEGTAIGLRNEFVWVFDYDPNDDPQDRRYYRDHEQPLEIENGKWAFHDAPIGSESDPIGQIMVVAAVRASIECSKKIENARPNEDGDVIFKGQLPSGCRIDDKIRLVKARP